MIAVTTDEEEGEEDVDEDDTTVDEDGSVKK